MLGADQLTVTLQGFQSAVYNKVVVESGRTTDLRVRLTAGGIEVTDRATGEKSVRSVAEVEALLALPVRDASANGAGATTDGATRGSPTNGSSGSRTGVGA